MRPESLYFLFSPVTRLKGIGSATAKALERLLPPATVVTGGTMPVVRDLLFHLPIGIVDRRVTYPLSAVPDGAVATFVVTVDEHQPPKRRGKSPYKILCSNDTGDITLVFFHASENYLMTTLPVGSKRVISGRCEHFDYRLQMPHPDIVAPVSMLAEVQRVEPVYPLTAGITSRRIGSMVDAALEKLPELPEWLEDKKWPAWKEALRLAHHPNSEEELSPDSPSHLRLAYDEMLAGQLHLAILRRHMQQQAGEIITGTGKYVEALTQSLPFTLTGGQQQALKEIHQDMASGHRMGRLLQGDVGSGKTMVALLAMLRAAEQGLQSALMAPTELIAMQHYEVISKLVADILPEACFLTGSVKGREREEVLEGIRSGKTKLIIGTHALFQEHVEFANLALVVIDEQHRFGVNQRMALTAKGNAPHVLHMSATPIPRSLTMTIYGDMDISQLIEKPAGRQPIATRVIPLSRYQEVAERMKAALERGEKAYWICPLIEEGVDGGRWLVNSVRDSLSTNHHSPSTDLAAAKSRFAEFKARFGPVVGLVHGRMKADERNEEMRKFAEGETKLLVATTVVEVGVDVRDATIMVIEHAERFGLSQLHQLRGRVGRGDKPSSCVLLYSEEIKQPEQVPLSGETPLPSDAVKRLSILRETDDGFRIAEEDLKIRGGGDLLGQRQSGMPRFIFTDIFRHREYLARAREEARQVVNTDPQLATPRGQALTLLLQLFGFEVEDYSARLNKSSSGG